MHVFTSFLFSSSAPQETVSPEFLRQFQKSTPATLMTVSIHPNTTEFHPTEDIKMQESAMHGSPIGFLFLGLVLELLLPVADFGFYKWKKTRQATDIVPLMPLREESETAC